MIDLVEYYKNNVKKDDYYYRHNLNLNHYFVKASISSYIAVSSSILPAFIA